MTVDKQALIEVRDALQYAANYRYGDGDVTHMFNKALTTLNQLIARITEVKTKQPNDEVASGQDQ